MEMPVISECVIEPCAYNRDRRCHALAITVGNTRHAQCDTFMVAPCKGGDPSSRGAVGACKMSDCKHNVDFECQAPGGIKIGFQLNGVDCLTYNAR